MENKINLKHNKSIHLGNSLVLYTIYNSDTLEKLINMAHRMHNSTTRNEKLYASKCNSLYNWYLSKDGFGHHANNSLFYLRTLREKYIKRYEEFIHKLCMYGKAI